MKHSSPSTCAGKLSVALKHVQKAKGTLWSQCLVCPFWASVETWWCNMEDCEEEEQLSRGASQVSYLSFPRSSMLAWTVSCFGDTILRTIPKLLFVQWGSRSSEWGYTSPSSMEVSQLNDWVEKLCLHSWIIWMRWWRSNSGLSGPCSLLSSHWINSDVLTWRSHQRPLIFNA